MKTGGAKNLYVTTSENNKRWGLSSASCYAVVINKERTMQVFEVQGFQCNLYRKGHGNTLRGLPFLCPRHSKNGGGA